MELKRRFGQVRAIEDKERTAEFIISTATKDRHGTVLNPAGWDLGDYQRNPIVGYNHDVYGGLFSTNPDNIIGKSEVMVEGDTLVARATFEPEGDNPLADKIWKKLQFGTIRAASVGFYPIEQDGKEGYWGEGEEDRDGANPTFYYYGQKLLEWSVVNIPSNPDAVKKAAPEEKTKMLRWVIDQLFEGKKLEEIEGLTVKGLLAILEGADAKKVLEGDQKRKVTEYDLFYYEQIARLSKYKYGK